MAAPYLLSLSLGSGLDSGIFMSPGGAAVWMLHGFLISAERTQSARSGHIQIQEREGSLCSPSRMGRFHEAALCLPSRKLYSPVPWLPFSMGGWAHDLLSAPTHVILLSPPILLLFEMIYKWLVTYVSVVGWGVCEKIDSTYLFCLFPSLSTSEVPLLKSKVQKCVHSLRGLL